MHPSVLYWRAKRGEAMALEQPKKRDRIRSVDEFQVELFRSWRRDLLARGFTEGQVSGLIVAKLLYIRGSIRG